MGHAPLFSIIIPSFARPGLLTNCLQSLQGLQFRRDGFEVIVADDASPEPLEESTAHGAYDFELRWVRQRENQGPAAARNLAAAAARGRYLAFTDDDALVDPNWLNHLLAALEANPGSAVGGKIADARSENLCCAADQAILDAVYAYYDSDPSQAKFFSTMNLAVRADNFRRLGGFDASFRTSEDREFCARWLESGRRMAYAPEALVVHAIARTLAGFWKRHYDFGKGAYRFRRRVSTRLRLEPAHFYLSLLGAPLRQGFSLKGVVVSFLIMLSQCASTLGFLSERRRHHSSTGRSS